MSFATYIILDPFKILTLSILPLISCSAYSNSSDSKGFVAFEGEPVLGDANFKVKYE